MALLSKSAALYFSPESIGSDAGARCEICWKFNPEDKLCLEVLGSISGPKGVCGLYVNGEPMGHKVKAKVTLVSKTEAGYVEDGPTHCANCEHMIVRKTFGESRCSSVEGMVEGRGCCTAAWERK